MNVVREKSVWRIPTRELRVWLQGLVQSGKRVVAPVQRGRLRIFQEVTSSEEITLSPGNAQWSPKEFLFPRTEPLFNYRYRAEEITLADPDISDREQVLVGLHPCDAAGLVRLDGVLLADPYYARRRELTTVVSLACSINEPACFCPAVGVTPAGEEGADIILVERDDAFLVRVITDKGAALTGERSISWKTAAPEEWVRTVENERKLVERIRQAPIASGSAERLEARFESPVWDDLAHCCVGCSICTYVCPSCSCFDVADEGNTMCGTRCRTWDSCSTALFTQHGTGHNPRPTQASRFRQRLLHKFAYYPIAHDGKSMCVGCGRCVQLCPVGIDILHEVKEALQAPRETGDVHG
jgi:sulfhydrogenase subunit beta (sulfur reductase)